MSELGSARTPQDLLGGIERMLQKQVSPRMRAALLAVDRATFVRACDREFAYENIPLPLNTPFGPQVPPVRDLLEKGATFEALLKSGEVGKSGATISQPLIYVVAFALLRLDEGQRYLELGAGSGYGAALAAHVVGPRGHVTTTDVDPALVEHVMRLTRPWPNVDVRHCDGLVATDLLATHDRCWLTFSIAERPTALISALREDASLLAPIGPPGAPQTLTRFSKENGQIVEHALAPTQFVAARALISAAATHS